MKITVADVKGVQVTIDDLTARSPKIVSWLHESALELLPLNFLKSNEKKESYLPPIYTKGKSWRAKQSIQGHFKFPPKSVFSKSHCRRVNDVSQ